MNAAATLDILMGRLGRSSASLRANALKEMTHIQQTKLEGGATLPWFLITEDAETVTTIGERRIKLPSDFIREVDEKPLVYKISDAVDRKLVKKPYDDLMKEYGDEASGPPEKYSVRGHYIMLFPKPDAEYTILFPGYYARQITPQDADSSENEWFKWANDVILAETGLVMASQYLKDPDLSELFRSMIQDARQRLFVSEVAREEANRDRDMDEDNL